MYLTDHLQSMSAKNESVSMESARLNVISRNEKAVTAALKNVYFGVQHNLPNSIIPDLNDLCIDQVKTINTFSSQNVYL